MESKKSLEKYFSTERNHLEYINKYEENKIFFSELINSNMREDLEFALPIKLYKYAGSLNHAGNYSKSLNVLNEVENDLNKLKGNPKQYKLLHESTTYLKGVCLSRLNKNKESNNEFKKILKYNPTNDKYINWYKFNILRIVQKYLIIVMISGAIIAATTLCLGLFKIKLPYFVRIIGSLLLIISALSWFLSEKIVYKINFKHN